MDKPMDKPAGTIEVRHVGPLSYADLAPALDELKTRFATVTASLTTITIDPSGGRAGGMLFPLELVVGAAAIAHVTKLVELLTEDSYTWLKRIILNKPETPSKQVPVRRFLPFSIVMGGVRFLFHQPITNSELMKRVKAAQVFAEQLPPEVLLNPKGPGGYYYTWNEDADGWLGPYIP